MSSNFALEEAVEVLVHAAKIQSILPGEKVSEALLAAAIEFAVELLAEMECPKHTPAIESLGNICARLGRGMATTD